MNIFTDCPICGLHLTDSDLILSEGPLLNCQGCGQFVSQCSQAVYDDHMKRFNKAQPIDQNYRIHRKRLNKIRSYCNLSPGQTRMLDVGCSVGLFLEIAKESGYLVTGVEPAELATETARSKGLDVRCGFLEDLHFPESSFDVITMFEVIEHLKDPAGILKECHRILKPGGIIFISTGNAAGWTVRFLKNNWDYFDIQKGHISFFNPESLNKIVRGAGFRVVDFETRSVKISSTKTLYTKIIAELLNLPAKILNKGHDLLFVAEK